IQYVRKALSELKYNISKEICISAIVLFFHRTAAYLSIGLRLMFSIIIRGHNTGNEGLFYGRHP
ncbi:MAG: hypothetical protein ABFR82_17730, partial [Nitrospirota bacterium]